LNADIVDMLGKYLSAQKGGFAMTNKDIEDFKNSPRRKHIQATQKLAKERGWCKELDEDGRCQYPHCGCLFGPYGPEWEGKDAD
jgi:hypothetical protein